MLLSALSKPSFISHCTLSSGAVLLIYVLLYRHIHLRFTCRVNRFTMPNIRPLSEALQKVAIEELNEDPRRIELDIEAIRSWIKKMPHLKSREDDQFIITFLRGCKFSLEKAKKKIESFYRARAETPEFFANRDVCDKTLSEIMDFGFIIPMPVNENTPEPRVVLTQLGNYDPNKYTFVDVMKVTYFFGDL